MAKKHEHFYLKRFKKGKMNVKPDMIKLLMLCIQGRFGGGAINPTAIGQRIRKYLDEHHPSKNNKEHARNYAYLFACICNDYWLWAKSKKATEFFFTQERLDKLNIGNTLLVKGSELLQEMGLITFSVKVLRHTPIFRVYVFNVNLEKLHELCYPKIETQTDLEWNEDEFYKIKRDVEQVYGHDTSSKKLFHSKKQYKNEQAEEELYPVKNRNGDIVYLTEDEWCDWQIGFLSDELCREYNL